MAMFNVSRSDSAQVERDMQIRCAVRRGLGNATQLN